MRKRFSLLKKLYSEYLMQKARKHIKDKLVIEKENAEEIRATNITWKITENGGAVGYLKEYSGKQVNAINKMMAYESMAELLGLCELVPKSRLVRFKTKGACNEEKIGLLQEQAEGCDIYFIAPNDRRNMITPEFQMHMNDMNVLDTICHEMDHSPNNYNVILKNGSAINVKAFDNNGLGSFCCSADVKFESYKGCSRYVDDEGVINRPHLSKEIAERLKSIEFIEVARALKGKIVFLRVLYVWKRIKALNKAIQKTEKVRPNFLLESIDWNEDTVVEELSGEFGKTYLHGYIEDCYVKS